MDHGRGLKAPALSAALVVGLVISTVLFPDFGSDLAKGGVVSAKIRMIRLAAKDQSPLGLKVPDPPQQLVNRAVKIRSLDFKLLQAEPGPVALGRLAVLAMPDKSALSHRKALPGKVRKALLTHALGLILEGDEGPAELHPGKLDLRVQGPDFDFFVNLKFVIEQAGGVDAVFESVFVPRGARVATAMILAAALAKVASTKAGRELTWLPRVLGLSATSGLAGRHTARTYELVSGMATGKASG